MQYIMKGGKPLTGDVFISGAKNAALGILAAAIMSDETVTIDNLPDVKDISVLLDAMEEIGVVVEHVSKNMVKINGAQISSTRVDNAHIKRIRAGYYLLGALLGKYHHAEVALPGGCNIGSRPIDQHLKGFKALGATSVVESGIVHAEAPSFHGGHVYLDVVSVGATINVMLAAALAPGNTIIENTAKEPHVVDIANMLNKMGANIRGAGTDVMKIRGVEKLHGTEYSVIPDQIEAGTFMMAAAVTGGDITVHNIIPQHMDAISSKLIEMGCEITEFDEAIRVVGSQELHPCNVKTLPYPGFPTDMQPQICVALSLADGRSVVTESIFENRFKYVDELTKMGAHIKVEGNIAVIEGVGRFSGAELVAPDLRAGAALVLAGLAAEGFSSVINVEYIMRGYENFTEKLSGLGADIELAEDEKEAKKFQFRIG